MRAIGASSSGECSIYPNYLIVNDHVALNTTQGADTAQRVFRRLHKKRSMGGASVIMMPEIRLASHE
jgi:hypothetical protein